MSLIKQIHIKNFRSIVNQTIDVDNLNVFVGLNDTGKSNVLKALNLFFNEETDLNKSFDFDQDYSIYAPVRANKAKEITIQIKFFIPETYTDSGLITWKKVWRKEGLNKDEKDKEFSARSRAGVLLDRIKYQYIPAVKSNNYFKFLLGSLYNSISSSVDTDIIRQSENYSEALQRYTQRISDIVRESIGISSVLMMPQNQIDIFKELSFVTNTGNDRIPLSQRGDGIKARHIPAILKFISEQDNIGVTRGNVPYTTVWGFEEPENGVELSKCYSMSEEFLSYSSDIQMFITTHSPAFYISADPNRVNIFSVIKDNDTTPETKLLRAENTDEINQDIGLMPLVVPFIYKKNIELQETKRLLNENFLTDINTIAVEGKTDKAYLELAIRKYSAKLNQMIDSQTLRILTKEDGCGTTQLCNWAIAWGYAGFRKKLLILLDRDEAGHIAKEEISRAIQNPIVVCQSIQPSDEIISVINVLADRNSFRYEIEHLLSIEFWELLKEHNFVTLKTIDELFYCFGANLQRNKTIDNIIDELIEDVRIRDTIVTFNPDDNKKDRIIDLVKSTCSENPATDILNGFRRTIERIERVF